MMYMHREPKEMELTFSEYFYVPSAVFSPLIYIIIIYN